MGLLILLLISKFVEGFGLFSYRKRKSTEDILEMIMNKINHLEILINSSSNKIDYLEALINETKKQIENSTLILQHQVALRYAQSSSGMIIISPESPEGNQNACGTLIIINNSLYFVTNRHVLYNELTKTIRTIIRIILYDGTILSFSSEIIMFDSMMAPDIALIKIKPDEGLIPKAVVPLNQDISLGQQLFGISNRQIRPVFVKCDVVEIPNSTFIETNCPGTHGSSGTGYLNDSGYLIAIHLGQGCFCDELSCSTNETDCENQIDYDNQFCPAYEINTTNQTNFESQINSTNQTNFESQFNSTNQTDYDNQFCLAYEINSTNQTDFESQFCPANHFYTTGARTLEKVKVYLPFKILSEKISNLFKKFYDYAVLDSIDLMYDSLQCGFKPEDTMKRTQKYIKRRQEISDELNGKIIEQTKLISRNARARAICSKYIFDLLDNKYNNTIKLYLAEEHTFE